MFFERNTLDQTLSEALLEDVNARNVKEMVVITGPGGFTSLRVGSLVCNLLAHYVPTLSFRVVSKLDCYKRCVHNAILPPHGLVYIGQKKTLWDYDFVSNTYLLVNKDISVDEKYFVEYIDDYYDAVDEEKKALYAVDKNGLYLQYAGVRHHLDTLLATTQLSRIVQPSYYVQPIIGVSKKK